MNGYEAGTRCVITNTSSRVSLTRRLGEVLVCGPWTATWQNGKLAVVPGLPRSVQFPHSPLHGMLVQEVGRTPDAMHVWPVAWMRPIDDGITDDDRAIANLLAARPSKLVALAAGRRGGFIMPEDMVEEMRRILDAGRALGRELPDWRRPPRVTDDE